MRKQNFFIGLVVLFLITPVVEGYEAQFKDKVSLVIENGSIIQRKGRYPDVGLDVRENEEKVIFKRMVRTRGAGLSIKSEDVYEINNIGDSLITKFYPQWLKPIMKYFDNSIPESQRVIRAYRVSGGYVGFLTIGEDFLIEVQNHAYGQGAKFSNLIEYIYYEKTAHKDEV